MTTFGKLIPGLGQVKCRHCGSTDVRLSNQGNLGSKFVVYRCRACREHFKVNTAPRLSAPVRITLALVLLVVVALAGIYFFGDKIDEYRATSAYLSDN